ncbi:MAG: prolipoprotein diacylglyceryl transferase [Isosphaeraceae bacterium]|nr:prolipoprotein diacylglyceryl transferase [Isosphaeraceae bacterium]
MWPILFEVPGTGIRLYGFGMMLVLAILGASHLALRRARREGLDPEVIAELAVWLVVGGVLGARAFYVIQHREAIHSLGDIVRLGRGGIVYYGSILGGVAAGLLLWSRRRFPLRPTMDVVAPSLALGSALGRCGCFLNGCCYGDPSAWPWAVRFPARSLPWASQVAHGLISPLARYSLPVHPTQLYGVIDGLVLLLLLSAYYPLRRRDGEVMGLLMVTYPITRFLIEALRNDEAPDYAGLTISQALSVLLLLAGLVYWFWLSRLPLGRHADAAEPSAAVG